MIGHACCRDVILDLNLLWTSARVRIRCADLEGVLKMKGDPKVIRYLNTILTNQLTAVNQYFLHARMLKNWGLLSLAERICNESMEEMKGADLVIQRILVLEGLPNLQDMHRLKTGEDTPELLSFDLAGESHNRGCLQEAISYCEETRDYQTRVLFEKILEITENHIVWLETQLSLIERVGIQNYLQGQIFKAS
ncbi:bacterioferritin [Azospirillaceae bacterium]